MEYHMATEQPNNTSSQTNKDLPIYLAEEVQAADAFDEDGTIKNRIIFLNQEFRYIKEHIADKGDSSQAGVNSIQAGRLITKEKARRVDVLFAWLRQVRIEPAMNDADQAKAFDTQFVTLDYFLKYLRFLGNGIPRFWQRTAKLMYAGLAKAQWTVDRPEILVFEEPELKEDLSDAAEEPPEITEEEDVAVTTSRKPNYQDAGPQRPPEVYGHNGLTPGDMFSNQKAAVWCGGHADYAGCGVGYGFKGPYSIIVADKNGNLNVDHGNTVIYASPGASNPEHNDPHKAPENKWVESLRTASKEFSEPVRLFRKVSQNPNNTHAPKHELKTALRYDGLYWVLKTNYENKVDSQTGRTGGIYETFDLARIEPKEDTRHAAQSSLEAVKARALNQPLKHVGREVKVTRMDTLT